MVGPKSVQIQGMSPNFPSWFVFLPASLVAAKALAAHLPKSIVASAGGVYQLSQSRQVWHSGDDFLAKLVELVHAETLAQHGRTSTFGAWLMHESWDKSHLQCNA